MSTDNAVPGVDQRLLDELFQELKSGKYAERVKAVREVANPNMPDSVPVLVYSDDSGDVMSIPDDQIGVTRVYGRQPGGKWQEVQAVGSSSDDGLDFLRVSSPKQNELLYWEAVATLRLAYPTNDPAVIESMLCNIEKSVQLARARPDGAGATLANVVGVFEQYYRPDLPR